MSEHNNLTNVFMCTDNVKVYVAIFDVLRAKRFIETLDRDGET